MKRLLFTLLTLLFLNSASAHPGIGIVKDSKGNIYYTDLKQVWKISAEGKRTIAVPNVHTHELYMDANDELYGEHLWYNGESVDTWGSFAWCLRSSGKLDTVVGPKEGFLEGYSFVRDAEGNQYWAERFTVSRIKKKTPDGMITTIAEGKFKDIRWMHATADGVVYFVDQLDLYEIDKDGKLVLVVKELAEKPSTFSLQSARHSIFGIWLDGHNNIYTAVSSQKTVKKISSDGKVSDIVYSVLPWFPVGGVFDDAGNLWLMEFNNLNETRVRKIDTEELKQPPSKIKAVAVNKVLPISIAAALIVVIGFGVKKLFRKSSIV